MLSAALVALCANLGSPERAWAAELDPSSAAWNGLSELRSVAAAAGIELRPITKLDLSKLRPEAGLLIANPEQPPPRADLSAFLREGGRLAIADDFGAAEGLLASFQIEREDLDGSEGAVRLRGNRNVLIATPGLRHPLTANVTALVVNHARTLRHPGLEPLFQLGEAGHAVALSGAVGVGRLVALGDPSVLINNMLELPGNRRFAENLVRYLGEKQNLVWLATPKTAFEGRYPALAEQDPLSGLETALGRIARIELPPAAVRWLSAVLMIALMTSALLALPRRSEYLRAASTPFAQTLGGDAGRARLFTREGGNLLVPLLVFEHELGVRLREALRLPFDAEPHVLFAAMQARNLPPDLISEARELLMGLGALKLAADSGRSLRVEPKKFRASIAAGERMLSALEPKAKSRA